TASLRSALMVWRQHLQTDELLPGGKYVGSDRIAGRFIVQYQKLDDDDGVVHELALAPALGCEVMEELKRWPGTLGIPGAEWRYRVTSYQAGEPDGNLFQVPAGYAIEQMREWMANARCLDR
ncbi:MAG TPA: hypothetical protein VKG25_10200, partial [Bryobacteraceae bacterium]|nr:hypothetical protein [Bryobacteraceae bacterium]